MSEKKIVLNRSFLEWEWIGSPEAVSLYVFLLLRASTKNNEVCGFKIRRGQVLILRTTLIRNLGLTTQKLTTALRRLSEGGYITLGKARRYYLITLNRYDEFVADEAPQIQSV